jgi:hypothetical protein
MERPIDRIKDDTVMGGVRGSPACQFVCFVVGFLVRLVADVAWSEGNP